MFNPLFFFFYTPKQDSNPTFIWQLIDEMLRYEMLEGLSKVAIMMKENEHSSFGLLKFHLTLNTSEVNHFSTRQTVAKEVIETHVQRSGQKT